MNSAGSSTGQTGRSGWSRSPRYWPPCSARTSRPTAPHPTAGCSTEPAAGRSADRSTPGLAIRPHPRPRARASRQRARPAPDDLRHAALSLWLNAGGDPAQIAARAGHSVAVLLTVYSHCIHGQDDLLNQQIDHVLGAVLEVWSVPVREKASGYTRPRDGRGRRPLCVRDFPARPADGPQNTPARNRHSHPDGSHFPCLKAILEQYANSNGLPDPAHGWPKDGPRTARTGTQRPVTLSDVTGFGLRK
jgi:hypothetical protein